MACLPWWHKGFAKLANSSRVRSGCSTTASGNVNCKPEAMRAKAEKDLGIPLSLAEYSLARNIASEVGSGTPEEKVALAESTVRFAKGDVVKLLLFRQSPGHPNYGWYGPVHDPSGGAPYGRWSATSQDPKLDDIAIAKFVLSGKSGNFSKGANDQLGMDIILRKSGRTAAINAVKANAARGDYWVGLLPGVNHHKIFLFFRAAPGNKALLERGLAAIDVPPLDWSKTRVCLHPAWWGVIGVGVAGATYYGWKKYKQRQQGLGAVYKGERLLDVRAKQVKRVVPKELPQHIYPFAEFMVRQSQKPLTPKDLIKAYVITVSSIQRQAQTDESCRRGSAKCPGGWPGHTGKVGFMHRPEDTMAQILMGTKAGHDYLEAAAKGKLDYGAAYTIVQRFPWGLRPTLMKQMGYAVDLGRRTPEVARALGTKRWLNYASKNIKGVSYAKAGFLASLLGDGSNATADAREISFWTCPRGAWNIPKAECCISYKGKQCEVKPPVPAANEAFVKALNKRMKALKIRMPERYMPFYNHLAHHTVWDAINRTKTVHRPLYKAMELAGDE